MAKMHEDKVFYSIKEASELTGVPAHTIRFWEKNFGMYLKPHRTPGGQRRYNSGDLEVIEKIKHFRYKEKYTVAGTIKEIANGRSALKDLGIDRVVEEIADLIREKVMEKVEKSA